MPLFPKVKRCKMHILISRDVKSNFTIIRLHVCPVCWTSRESALIVEADTTTVLAYIIHNPEVRA